MKYDPIDPDLFCVNRAALAERMAPRSLAVVHSNDVMPTNADGVMPFKQNSDFFYLTGIGQEESILLFFPEALHPDDQAILFLKETNAHIAVWEGHKLTKPEGRGISGIISVKWLSEFDTILSRVMMHAESVYLLTNEHPRAQPGVATRNDRFIEECRSRYPLHRYERLAPLLTELRSRKHPEEISQIQQAIDITEQGFRRVLEFMEPGVGEWEVEAEFLHEFISRRSRGFAYQPIIASGENSCVLHYVENSATCESGELVLMDVAAEWANWNADMTRTIPVNGRFTERQAAVYQSVLKVLKEAREILRPGVFLKDYQSEVLRMMEAELLRLGLFSKRDLQHQQQPYELTRRYFMHGTSHHLGLDVHDVTPPDGLVKEGMVFTIEPGIYIPEEELGIRLENNVFIGSDSNQDLFENIPIEIEEIESLMNPPSS